MEELKLRTYQIEIVEAGKTENTLIVIPTGLGKTFIGLALIEHYLKEKPGSKAVFLAPTKPLVDQHLKTAENVSNFEKCTMAMLTGKTASTERPDVWKNNNIIFATPQTIRNDLKKNRITLDNVSIIVFDEAHRATGDYAYTYIAGEYIEKINGRIIGMTASPGCSKEDIVNVCQNLHILKIEHRAEEDVKDYIKEKEIENIYVDFPQSFRDVLNILKECEDNRRDELISKGYQKYKLYKKTDLLHLQAVLMEQIRKRKFFMLKPMYLVTQIIKIKHAEELIQTQGISSLYNYFEKMKTQKSKATNKLLEDDLFTKAIYMTEKLYKDGFVHPKCDKLIELVQSELNKGPSKIILFTNFRETSRLVCGLLEKITNAKPVQFFGQREGMSQKKQIDILDKFKQGEYNILISTSIGEEGIHVEEADLGVFFEPVPSALRMIQRKGRIGRTNLGRIYILLTKDCLDETYYNLAMKKEKKMYKVLKDVNLESQTTLGTFSKKDKGSECTLNLDG